MHVNFKKNLKKIHGHLLAAVKVIPSQVKPGGKLPSWYPYQSSMKANDDRDEALWLFLMPIHLEDEAAWWYEGQTKEVKANWTLLTKALCNLFQEKESCQFLMSHLSLMHQKRPPTLTSCWTTLQDTNCILFAIANPAIIRSRYTKRIY